ncbi:SRPBCC family protein [Bradyrhizobium tropiciagri]|uniref:SRPBCC family protein n=1 Tax=Bradyrhizobium tropiciagri TaxID=312253 RepID=UPI001BAD91B4|nr:SRPBCC family protein [Bradyrhizobium tropiciagri]MBR0872510.1 SRPBCC family protein [Bradyrhizobium tropiciagri]
MKIDPIAYVGAVVREVAFGERDGKPTRAVIATRGYDTDIDDLWDALTNPERIPRWFLPISGDLRLGGRYKFEGQAGGEIRRCEPPRRLAVTWEAMGSVSWVTVTLAEDGAERTRLELEHVAVVEGEFWDRYGPGAVGVGWDLALLGLALYLATPPGEAFDRAAASAWPASDDGKDFIRRSSSDWSRASIAAGTDEVAARRAAANTTAFYCGEPEPGSGG